MAERFANLLSENLEERAAHDTIIAERHGCILAPTLGSIVPNWLLLIPRDRSSNFANWLSVHECSISELVTDTLHAANLGDRKLIWFEHGAVGTGAAIGCGVDHAHIHILFDQPFTLKNLLAKSSSEHEVSWKRKDRFDCYNEIADAEPYLALGNSTESFFVQPANNIPSQFLRRCVASIVGAPHKWDYRAYPFASNIAQTIETCARANHGRLEDVGI